MRNQIETEAVLSVKKRITRKRIEITDIKSEVDKLGEETQAIMPEDIIIMYVGKICDNLNKNNVRSQNILAAYLRSYEGIIDDNVRATLIEYQKLFNDDFVVAKERLDKIASQHPLWQRFKDVKGFSAYALGLLMALYKDVSKFDTPSKFCAYGGVTCVGDRAVTKANLNHIKEHYHDIGIDYKGFNTQISGRMFNIGTSLVKGCGYFYIMYTGIRERLTQRCMNNNECFLATAELANEYNKTLKTEEANPDDEDIRKKKVKMIEGRYYMKNKKCQSLEQFTHSNALRRIERTLLHLLYTEWRTLRGLPARNPYAIDYLLHTGYISLDDVIAYDSTHKAPRKSKEEKESE